MLDSGIFIIATSFNRIFTNLIIEYVHMHVEAKHSSYCYNGSILYSFY